jgi:hypothetical protein
MLQSRAVIGGFAVVLCSLSICLSCSTVSSGSGLRYSDKPIVSLRGTVGGYAWIVGLRGGSDSTSEPCVSVQLFKEVPGSLGGTNTVCGSFDPIPLLDEASIGSGISTRAAVGMVFPPNIIKVRIKLRNRRERHLDLHLLTRRKARSAHVGMFRYGAVTFAGRTCISRIVPYDAESSGWQAPGIRGGCGH